jgi:DNA-binding transcriptional LysR family regulator
VVALAAGHPLARRRGLDLEVLADAPWIDAPMLSPRIGAAARGSHTPWTVRYDGHDLSTLLCLVAAGHGAVLLPAHAFAGATEVAAVPLIRPHLVQRTELLTLRTLTGRNRLLADALRAEAADTLGADALTGGLRPP